MPGIPLSIREKFAALADDWRKNGLPSSSELMTIGRDLANWKQQHNASGLWPEKATPPQMVTATLDDGLGQGLKLIELYAELAGVTVIHIGLLVEAEEIIRACVDHQPDFLGLTVLRSDAEELLIDEICGKIPENIDITVGGPVFKPMDAAERAAKPYRVLNDLAAFVEYLLRYSGSH